MPPHHLIRWLADGSSEWLSLAADGAPLDGPAPGLPPPGGRHVSLLLPAEDVLCLAVPRVARQASQLARALPFAVEEQLVAPVESQHVAFDASQPGESLTVAVVARDYLDVRLAACAAAGLEVDACYAEWQLLPLAESAASAWQDRGRVVMRSAQTAICFNPGQLEALRPWLQQHGLDPAAARWWASAGEPALLPSAERLAQPLAWLSRQLPAASRCNLLQGDFRPRRRAVAGLRLWRFAAGWAALAVLLGLASLVLERRALEQHSQARQQEMEDLLRQTLPEVQRVVDPLAQMRAALQQQGQGSDALGLLARIAPLIVSGGSLTLDGLEYRSGVLELTLIAADVASLDLLRERLAQSGLQVELTGANPGSQGVEGRLRIRETRT